VIRIVIACRGEVFYSMAEFFLREPMSFLNLLPISLSLFSFSPLCGRRVFVILRPSRHFFACILSSTKTEALRHSLPTKASGRDLDA
jgi:hypothetical protein